MTHPRATNEISKIFNPLNIHHGTLNEGLYGTVFFFSNSTMTVFFLKEARYFIFLDVDSKSGWMFKRPKKIQLNPLVQARH
jgi:hypothetical protein